MQTWLKISFWFSVVVAIWASSLGSLAGGYVGWYLIVALFAFPGIFIRAWLYKVASLLIFCAWLIFAYQDREAGKRREAWMLAARKDPKGKE